MLHTDYYSVPTCFGIPNVKIIEEHIYESEGIAREQTVSDFRFANTLEYQGIGNSDCMRVNACATLNLQLWALNPSDKESLTEKRTAIFLLKPFAALFDCSVNGVLVVAKFAATFFIMIGKMVEKTFSSQENVGFRKALRSAAKNVAYQSHVFLQSSLCLAYQICGGFILNLLGPEHDLFQRLSGGFHWAYFVNKGSEKVLVLDKGRVDYLRNQCGWERVTDEVLQTFCKPFFYPPTLVKYKREGDNISFSALWVRHR